MTAIFPRSPPAVPLDSFSVVMATGIVSVAASVGGYVSLSYVLTALAAAAFVALGVSIAWRLTSRRLTSRAWSRVGDLGDPTYVSGIYAFVAACDVLNASFYRGAFAVSVVLGLAALGVWLVLAPVAWRAVRSRPLPMLRRQARGSWLLAAVGTHSLAVTAAHLATVTTADIARSLLGAALVWWVLGVAIYLTVTALILWGAVADSLTPRDVSPDGWILMGGLAIAALAGGEIYLAASSPPAFPWLGGVLAPATLGVWVAGSAWIPVLLAAEGWAAWRRGVPGYQRARWATVFPLGMYAAATYTLARVLGSRPGLELMADAAFGVALAVWSLTALGLCRLGWARLGAGRTE